MDSPRSELNTITEDSSTESQLTDSRSYENNESEFREAFFEAVERMMAFLIGVFNEAERAKPAPGA